MDDAANTAEAPEAERPVPATTRGMTPRELARLLRISPDRVRAMIVAGELGAVNTAPVRCGRPRFVVLRHHLAKWEEGRKAVQPKASKRRRPMNVIDFYPD